MSNAMVTQTATPNAELGGFGTVEKGVYSIRPLPQINTIYLLPEGYHEDNIDQHLENRYASVRWTTRQDEINNEGGVFIITSETSALNRYDIYIPANWQEDPDFHTVIICELKHNPAEPLPSITAPILENLSDITIEQFLNSFGEENMSDYLKENMDLEIGKIKNITNSELLSGNEINDLCYKWFGNYANSATWPRESIANYISNAIKNYIKNWNKYSAGTEPLSGLKHHYYIFLAYKLGNIIDKLQEDFLRENGETALLKRHFDRTNDNNFSSFAAKKIQIAIKGLDSEKTT